MKTIILAVGGTGGHIYPAMALAEYLQRQLGVRPLVAGKQGGQEQRISESRGLEFRAVRAVHMPAKKISPAALRFGGDIMTSIADGVKLIGEVKPGAVVGFGGYVSFPAAFGALVKGVPVFLHEQNALAGRANLFLSKFARNVFVSYENTIKSFGDKAILTGNPSRFEGMESPGKEEAAARLGLEPGRKTILVFGGSQGAKSINDALFEFAELRREDSSLQVLHLVGVKNYDSAIGRYNEALCGESGLKVVVKDYLEDMNIAYAAADITVCRSGATSIAELTSLGAPSILVPYPFATGDHQAINAKALQETGAALVIKDSEFNGKRLEAEIVRLFAVPEHLKTMSERARALYIPGAAKRMCEKLSEYLS